MKTMASVITAAAILSGGAYTAIRAQSHNHVIQTTQEAQWGPAPPMLPAGAQIAVLSGDPSKVGPLFSSPTIPGELRDSGPLPSD